MEPEGSLLHSQASAFRPYPGMPNPVHIPTTHLLEIHPNIIHPSTLGLASGLFSPPGPYTPPSPPPYEPHTQPISFFSILSPAQYCVRSTDHLAPRYAVSSIPPLQNTQ